MRFKNGTLSFTFQYEQETVPADRLLKRPKTSKTLMGFAKVGPGKVRKTTCTIRRAKPGCPIEDGQILAKASALQSPNSADNKFLARKYAMKFAMEKVFSRVERKPIWKEYLAKVAIPGKSASEKTPCQT